MRTLSLLTTCIAAGLLTACSGTAANGDPAPSKAGAIPHEATPGTPPANAQPFAVEVQAQFGEPWAMAFLPDGRLLVTQKTGELKMFDPAKKTTGDVTGVPKVDHGGQGGLGEVTLHPQFASNGIVYLGYAEAGDNDTRGAAVARAKLTLDANGGGALSNVDVIWRQVPKVSGRGHYSHRIVFSPDGKYMYISSGDRQKFDPAQDMASNMGKILRLNDDGSIPLDNPFANKSADLGGIGAQVWSLGHRNILGLAFDAQGRLWDNEMGPKGGDELNLIVRGDNYGYPIVSNGDHYDGRNIPDHDTHPEFNAPEVTWTPVISPSSMIFYSGDLFADWKGDALIGGLSSQGLVRVKIAGDTASEAARYDMGARIREVEQGPDGAVWVLEDERDGSQGRLLKLTPQG